MMTRRWLIAVMFATSAMAVRTAGLQAQSRSDVALRTAIETETLKGDPKSAVAQFQELAAGNDRAIAAQALLHLASCYEKLGLADARGTYEQVMTKYADQPGVVSAAKGRLAALDAQAVSDTARVRLWVLPPGRAIVGVSPNGRYVPFTILRDGNQSARSCDGSLWVHDLTAGKDRNILKAPGAPNLPPPFAFSPDGRQIAYGADSTDGFELRIATLDGSGTRVLWRKQGAHTPDSATAGVPIVVELTWLSDGRHIAAHVSGPTTREGSDVTISLSDGSADVRRADFRPTMTSPDGKYRLRVVQGNVQVIEVGPVNGNAIPLFPGSPSTRFGNVHWSVDSRYVFFWSNRAGQTAWAWWVQRLTEGKPDGEPELLRGPMGGGSSANGGLVGDSADGSLFYTENTRSRNLYEVDLDPATGRVTSAASQINLSFVGLAGGTAARSHDGDLIAYTGAEPNTSPFDASTSRLVVKSLRSGEERVVSIAPINARNVWQWFPDGHSVIVDDQLGSGKMAWRRVEVETGKSSTVFDGQSVEHPAAAVDLTPDGKALVLSSDLPDHRTLLRRDLDTGEMKVLFEMPGEDTLWPAKIISPDGQQIAFGSHDKSSDTYIVRTIPVNGGPARELYRSKQETNLVGWTRDGRHVLLAQTDPTSSIQELLSLPEVGGSPVRSGLSMSRLYWTSTTPDGRHLVIPADTQRTELWVSRKLLADAKK